MSYEPTAGVAYVRQNVSRFFPSGAFNIAEFTSLVVRVALLAGAQDIEIRRWRDWTMVSSSRDWLADVNPDVFVEIEPFPAGGPNAMYIEVLATALASKVVTKRCGEVEVICGEVETNLLEQLGDKARVVAYIA